MVLIPHERREALLRRPNGVSMMLVALEDGTPPESVELPAPGREGGRLVYRLVSCGTRLLEYVLDRSVPGA